MAKIVLDNIATGFGGTVKTNSNNDKVEAEFQDKVLYRDNPVGEPNQMMQELDMNSNRIINLADGVQASDAATFAQLNAAISANSTGLIASQIETQYGAAAVANVFTFAGIVYLPGANNLEVYRNGLRLGKTIDYSETSASSITLTFTPNATDRFDFRTNTATSTNTGSTDAIIHAEYGVVSNNLAKYIQNRHVVNVKDEPFGALGDGVTDDTAAIQLALNTGLDIIIPSGTYLVSTTLNFSAEGQSLIGQGSPTLKSNGLVVANPNGGDPVPILQSVNLSDIEVAGITFDCNAETLGGFRATLNSPTADHKNIKVHDCSFLNTLEVFDAATGLIPTGNSFVGAITVDNRQGASFTYKIKGVSLYNNTFDNKPIGGGSSHGCVVTYAEDVSFVDNTVLSGGFHGMEAVECIDVVISRNHVEDCFQSALGVGTFVKNFTISDNVCRNCSGDGVITVEHNSINGVVSGNLIEDAINQGINVSYGTGGASPFNEVNNIIVASNVIKALSTAEGKIGINAYSSTGGNIGTGLSLKDNVLDGFATGIECSWLDFGQVTGNTVRRFGLVSVGRPNKTFIQLTGCDKIVVDGNICEQEVTEHAIVIDTSLVSNSRINVVNNIIQSATAGALVRKIGSGEFKVAGNTTFGAINYVSCDGTQSIRMAINDGPLSGQPLVGGTLKGYVEGTGTPEGVVAAFVGSTYGRLDGGAATSFYVKEVGSGDTGWVAK